MSLPKWMMEDNFDALVEVVRDIRRDMMRAQDERDEEMTEPTVAVMLQKVAKEPQFEGEKFTPLQIKRALREAKKRVEIEVEEV